MKKYVAYYTDGTTISVEAPDIIKAGALAQEFRKRRGALIGDFFTVSLEGNKVALPRIFSLVKKVPVQLELDLNLGCLHYTQYK